MGITAFTFRQSLLEGSVALEKCGILFNKLIKEREVQSPLPIWPLTGLRYCESRTVTFRKVRGNVGAQAPRIERQKGAGEGGFRSYSTIQQAVVMKHSSSLKLKLLNVIQSTLILLFTPVFSLPHLVKMSSVGKKTT